MDADITKSELVILMADVEFVFNVPVKNPMLFDRLLYQKPEENIESPTILLSHTEMNYFAQLKKHTTDKNNIELVQFPDVTEHMLDLSLDEDDVAMNDIID